MPRRAWGAPTGSLLQSRQLEGRSVRTFRRVPGTPVGGAPWTGASATAHWVDGARPGNHPAEYQAGQVQRASAGCPEPAAPGIQVLAVTAEWLGDLHAHGTIQVDMAGADGTLAVELGQRHQYILGALHGEGRNDHVAVPGQGYRKGFPRFTAGWGPTFARESSISRFYRHHLRRPGRPGLGPGRVVLPA